jgi:hypothetical protein
MINREALPRGLAESVQTRLRKNIYFPAAGEAAAR